MNSILWKPGPERVAASQMTAFTLYLEKLTSKRFSDYQQLWEWSIEHPTIFWPAVWNFCDVRASCLWENVLENQQRMPGAKWFKGAKLNFSENLIERGQDEELAILFRNEVGHAREMRRGELRSEVARIASWLRELGIGIGDRVAAWMPNIPETVVMLLATASLGATFSSCSPDFGIEAVVERFGQIEPKVILVTNGYMYGGKYFSVLPKVISLVERVPSIQHTLVVQYTDDTPRLKNIPGSKLWSDVGSAAPIKYCQLPFDHPLYILYSSGTTGTPKCIVHGAGGTLLQHLKEHRLHTDLQPKDRLFYFTTCGWMMWNWLVSGLASEATIVLYDGSPMQPHAATLFQLTEELGISVFGTSASYLASLEKRGVHPGKGYKLDRLKTILSTGSPLSEEGFQYVYQKIKSNICLSSISGGTDIVSCFALGNPNLPVRSGELQCRGLGMSVDIFDNHGNSLVGRKGELVCTQPFPSMPLGFWKDSTGNRYQQAYFERYRNIWCHGDFAELTQDGGMLIYGRSDAILNPGGVRIGTAEIYAHVIPLEEVVDCVAIGQDWEGDSRIVLFVQLHKEVIMDTALKEKIRQRIRSAASPRHVPEVILAVADIPKTRSGKTAELAVRDIIHQREVLNKDALANPEALTEFHLRRELN